MREAAAALLSRWQPGTSRDFTDLTFLEDDLSLNSKHELKTG